MPVPETPIGPELDVREYLAHVVDVQLEEIGEKHRIGLGCLIERYHVGHIIDRLVGLTRDEGAPARTHPQTRTDRREPARGPS